MYRTEAVGLILCRWSSEGGCAIFLKRLFLLTLTLGLVLAARAKAQTRDSATIRGRVLDPSGAVIPQAQITLSNLSTGLKRQTETAGDGRFSLSGLPLTGEYRLTASKAGFQTFERSGFELRAGEAASFEIVLGLSSLVRGGVTVHGTAGGVETDSPSLQSRLDLPTISEIPVPGRNVTALPLLDSAVRSARGTGDLFLNNSLFVINGGGRRQTTYSIDDSTGDDNWGLQTLFTSIPLSAIQEFTVLTNAFSAEYGWTSGSAVNLVTKSGTNRLHGEIIGLARPTAFEASPPLAQTGLGDALRQASGAVSGPLIRDRTYFLVSGEYDADNRDSVITSPLSPGLYTGHVRQSLFLARLDHQLNERNALAIRANFDRLSDSNPADAVGGLNLPSTGRTFRRNTYSAELSETATLGPQLVNEARLQFQLGSPITLFDPVSPSTQFVYPGTATVGESRLADLANHQYQAADTLNWIRGRHTVKLGAEVVYSSSGGFGREFGGGFVLGQFRVKPGITEPVSQLTINDVSQFTQSFGNASYNVRETLWDLFLQDDVAVTSRLNLDLGIRYERETFTDATENFSPRAGFAYRLPMARPTVVRGSYGIFYAAVPFNLAADYNIFGPQGIFTFTAAPGQLGFPTALQPLANFPAGAELPPRDITVRAGERAYLSQFFDVSKLRFYPDRLLNPRTQQWSFGVERELAPGWILSLDYVGQRTEDLLRPADLNAPAPFVRTAPGEVRSAAAADVTRPILPVPNGYRRIVAMVNQGKGWYDGLQANLNKTFSRNFFLRLSYTWSHTLNTVEPDVPQQDPNDSNFLGAAEKATSLLDQRHRAVLTGWYEFPWQITFGSSTSLASGRRFNATTGVDNNGDGSNADRPVVDGSIVSRNFGQGTPLYDVSIFLEKHVALTERLKLRLRGEAFNLFNHSNIVGRNGTYGDLASGAPLATFGQPLGGISNTDPAREFQFLVNLAF
jgi:Carboxypeptidase regulatory-like domain/TonB dependent receptor-like, beta-barrel